MIKADNWSPADAAELYGIRNWGANYFDINAAGEVCVKDPTNGSETAVSLLEIVTGIQQRGHALPLLLRIENLLDHQLFRLNESFRTAIAQCGYRGEYRGVFPVKVNQQAQVIEEIVYFGVRYSHGLEVGSKAELLLALAQLHEGGLLICNGNKDREFIDLGLWATKLGFRCFFVIESPNELALLVERSKALSVQPLIGARVKVSAKVGGMWTETSGDRSSFGLNTAQLVELVDTLKAQGMLDRLQLLHCHLGSQIPDLKDIRAGVGEACRFYAGLAAEGAPMAYLDLGGGLAVDYTGAGSDQVHSCNYTMEDYARSLVKVVRDILDPLKIPHPHLVTESGRATVAYASMLIFDILDVQHFEPVELPKRLPPDVPDQIQQLFDLHRLSNEQSLVQQYHEALACRDTIRDQFREGRIPLRMRSIAENLFLGIARQIMAKIDPEQDLSDELDGLRQSLADIYYGNFSVFQSLPDTWALDHTFPVMPLARHTERPTREATISDLTCDCDGKIDCFTLAGDRRSTLPVHQVRAGEDYLVGVFLMGAYQETLGDLHNLFGDTHVISLRLNTDGSFDVLKEITGDSISDVLSMVEYQPQALFNSFRDSAEAAVRQGRISVVERQAMLEEYAANLQGYTYFEK